MNGTGGMSRNTGLLSTHHQTASSMQQSSNSASLYGPGYLLGRTLSQAFELRQYKSRASSRVPTLDSQLNPYGFLFSRCRVSSVRRPSRKRKKKEPRTIRRRSTLDHRLDDEPIVRHLPKIRPALSSLHLPLFAFRHAPHKNLFNAT